MVTENKTGSKEPSRKEDKERNPFYEASRKVMLASIGAIALAQDELEDFVDKLIERGEIAEKEGNSLMHEMREKRKKRAQEMEKELTHKVRETMERMNIPSRADLENLTASISSLSDKIDELAKSRK